MMPLLFVLSSRRRSQQLQPTAAATSGHSRQGQHPAPQQRHHVQRAPASSMSANQLPGPGLGLCFASTRPTYSLLCCRVRLSCVFLAVFQLLSAHFALSHFPSSSRGQPCHSILDRNRWVAFSLPSCIYITKIAPCHDALIVPLAPCSPYSSAPSSSSC